MTKPHGIRFDLLAIFWLTSLFASGISSFGVAGIFIAMLVCLIWFIISRSENPRATFSTFVVGGVLFTLLVLLLLPAVSAAQRAARRVQCINHVKFITIGILAYVEDKGHFPPPFIADESGQPMHSWRVLILPYVDESNLYSLYRFDEPWNGPNNSRLLKQMPWIYACPTNSDSTDGLCYYAAVTGKNSAWQVEPPLTKSDFSAGLENTVTVCEVLQGIPWTKPEDITPEEFIKQVNEIEPTHRFGGHLHEDFFSYSRRSVHLGFADGHIRALYVPEQADMMAPLGSRSEKPDSFDYKPSSKRIVKWGRVVSCLSFFLLSLLPAVRVLK